MSTDHKSVMFEMHDDRSQVCHHRNQSDTQAVTTGTMLTGHMSTLELHSEGLAQLGWMTSLCPSGADKSQACTTQVLTNHKPVPLRC